MVNANLYAALRVNFPADLSQTAVETETGQRYSWADLEAGSAKMANVLQIGRASCRERV